MGFGRDPTRRLLQCGVVAGPLFVTAFLVEGARRPHYDPIRHPVSSLSLGREGWVQDLSFATAGVLYAATAVGLSRAKTPVPTTKAGPALIGAAAVGLLGAGAFKTDPIGGYPPGTPDVYTRHTAHGALHDLLSAPTFLGLPAAALVYARAFQRDHQCGWAAYSAATGAGMLTTFGLASVAFSQAPVLVRYGGLIQRVCIALGFSWLTALARRALQSGAHSPAAGRRPAPAANDRDRAPHYGWR